MQMMAPPKELLEERFARIDERFNRVDERFDETNRRIAETSRRIMEVDRRITEVDRRITEVDRRITEKSNETNLRLSRVEETNIELKRQVATLNTTFQRGNYALIATVIAAILTRSI